MFTCMLKLHVLQGRPFCPSTSSVAYEQPFNAWIQKTYKVSALPFSPLIPASYALSVGRGPCRRSSQEIGLCPCRATSPRNHARERKGDIGVDSSTC